MLKIKETFPLWKLKLKRKLTKTAYAAADQLRADFLIFLQMNDIQISLTVLIHILCFQTY